MTQEQFNKMMDTYLQETAAKPTSAWAQQSMDWAVSKGIIKGDANLGNMAQKFTTRQEVITMLERIVKELKVGL